MKCLEKTVERRYQSMGNLAEDLQRFIDGAEVSALREVSPSSGRVPHASDSDDRATDDNFCGDGDYGARSVDDQELVAVLEMRGQATVRAVPVGRVAHGITLPNRSRSGLALKPIHDPGAGF